MCLCRMQKETDGAKGVGGWVAEFRFLGEATYSISTRPWPGLGRCAQKILTPACDEAGELVQQGQDDGERAARTPSSLPNVPSLMCINSLAVKNLKLLHFNLT